MSTAETDQLVAEEPKDLLIREFRADLQVGDGRTVDVRIVPYGERITHDDGYGGVPRGVPYQEEFLPGAFNHQLNAANRITANVEHEKGIAGKVGHGVMLREMPDGLHGTFRLLDTPAGETTRQLIEAGTLDSVSLEARRVKDIRRDGVIQRAKVNLHGIAFTAFGAYKNARVLALREEAQLLDEELLPVDIDPERVERLRAQGIVLPSRYEAQPAQTDTSAQSDTSEDGTRQSEATTSSEE
jgi:HK97 family phage prohead protease